MNSANSYSAADALRAILDKVTKRDESLAERIQHAIDMGKDVREEESLPVRGRGRRRKRQYRKHVPFSDEEALQVAYGVLLIHFYVLPLVVNSACNEFVTASLGAEKRLLDSSPASIEWTYGREPTDLLLGKDKSLEIEVETEITKLKEQSPNQSLKPYHKDQVGEMKSLLDNLRALIE